MSLSKTLQKPIWRNTTIIRDNVIQSVRALKAESGKNILMPYPTGVVGLHYTLQR